MSSSSPPSWLAAKYSINKTNENFIVRSLSDDDDDDYAAAIALRVYLLCIPTKYLCFKHVSMLLPLL